MNLHDQPNILALNVQEREQYFRCTNPKVILTLLLPYSILALYVGVSLTTSFLGNVPWFLSTAFLPEEEKHWSDHYDLLSSYMVTQMKGKWKEKKQEKQSRKEIKKKCRHKKKIWGIKPCIVKYINWCKIKCHGVFSWKSWTDPALES